MNMNIKKKKGKTRKAEQREDQDNDYINRTTKKRKNSRRKCQDTTRDYNIWQKNERDELKLYFKPNYTTRKAPSSDECRKVVELSKKNGGILHERGFRLIQKKMLANIKKILN